MKYWSVLPFHPLGDLPDPEIEPGSPASLVLQADSLPLAPAGKPYPTRVQSNNCESYNLSRKTSLYTIDDF